MRKTRKSTKELNQEIERLKEQVKSAEVAEEAEFGRMARKTGVLDLDLNDAQKREGLDLIVERFQKGAKTARPTTSVGRETPQTGDLKAGAEHEAGS